MATENIYPYEIVSLVRQKSFGIEAHFNSECDPTHPLQMMGGQYTRFVFSIVEKGKRETANVPVELLADIKARTQYAFQKGMDAVSSGNTSPAFTVAFATGKYKGRTPADVRKTDGLDALREEFKFLRANVDKFPGNKKVMDAITEAAKLSEDALNASGTATAPITLLDIGCRPLVRKKRADGMCECYETKAIWDSSRNYPVTVTITRYFAPVVKADNGRLNVQLAQRDQSTVKTASFAMLGSEWLYAVDQMEQATHMFAMLHIRDGWKVADKADKDSRDAWRSSHGTAEAAPDDGAPADFMPAPESAVPEFSAPASEAEEDFELFSS